MGLGGVTLVETLAAAYPSITYGEVPGRADDQWAWTAGRLRLGVDYLRYQHPLFDGAPKLRERARGRTPGAFVALGDLVHRAGDWSRRAASTFVRRVEAAVPDDPAIRAFIEAHRPDLVLLTPLISLGSSQIDYLRAARSLGIPTALCVWSWDHLSSKALIREWPDRVFVWNDTQRREARKLHGVPSSQIVVTGAQCFDKWFDRQPSRDRAAFCRQIGLPADRPILLYVCSAPFSGSQPEAPFVLDWVRRIRMHASSRLRDTPILIRPHPSRRAEWEAVDLTPFADVAVWGSDPISPDARADYFDSLFHSAAVAGLNTSAFIEAAILGRPVFTILLHEWHESQMGTVHFRYLFEAGGGLLTSATGFDEHLAQLDRELANPSTEIRPFVRAFVRPRGLDVPATPVFVEQVEAMQGIAVPPLAQPLFRALAERILRKGIEWRDDVSREHLAYSERELERIVRLREMREAKVALSRERKRQEKEQARALKEQRQR